MKAVEDFLSRGVTQFDNVPILGAIAEVQKRDDSGLNWGYGGGDGEKWLDLRH